MHLEEYFDILGPDDIRIKGHRLGIESVLYEYVHRAQTPEEIAARFPTLDIEQIYATILYYLHNKAEVGDYLARWIAHEDRMLVDQASRPSPAVARLRRLIAERESASALAREPEPA